MPGDLRKAILTTSREIVAEQGVGALTYDAIARRLGKSKQAVIYWFPKKQDLLRELVVPWLEAEAAAVIEALAGARGRRDAVVRTVRTVVSFHTEDMDRFRHLYLAIQLDPRPERLLSRDTLERHVHPVTGRMYGAIEAALGQDDEAGAGSARRAAVAIHMAALGLVLMVALADAVDDPLAHPTDELADTMIALLAGPDDR